MPKKRHTTTSRSIEMVNNYARSKSKKALETLNAIMCDEKAPYAVRVKAAECMLDRAVGKPTQKHEQTVDVNIQAQHLEALKDAATLRRKAIEGNKAKVQYVEHKDQLTIEHVNDSPHNLA
jgi:hypothetical protein